MHMNMARFEQEMSKDSKTNMSEYVKVMSDCYDVDNITDSNMLMKMVKDDIKEFRSDGDHIMVSSLQLLTNVITLNVTKITYPNEKDKLVSPMKNIVESWEKVTNLLK